MFQATLSTILASSMRERGIKMTIKQYLQLVWALTPFILVCLGLLSIVIAGFLVAIALGWLILGIGLILVGYILSPKQEKSE